MKKLYFLQFFYFLFNIHILQASDLTIVGYMKYSDGLGRIPIGLIDILKEDISINFIGSIEPLNIEDDIKEIAFNPDKTPGRVSILTSQILWSPHLQYYQDVPESKIKLAYSMFESTRIPPIWVEILNAKFDAVVVPDPYLTKVYKNSGVQIPIFVLPLGMYLNDFFMHEPHNLPKDPFIFGALASYIPHKNLSLTIQAFGEEFGNSKEVFLSIHGRWGTVNYYQDLAKNLGVSNIVFNSNTLNQKDYVELLNSLDCYINISKGEGFSCCPREALALGIPCILSNNSAQKTLCKSGFVKSIRSSIVEKAYYGAEYYDSQPIGNQFNCDLADIKQALRDVYTHYKFYIKLAKSGRKWVSKYSWSNLKLKYLNLVKPKIVILGNENIITDKYLMTDSLVLYKKYKNIDR